MDCFVWLLQMQKPVTCIVLFVCLKSLAQTIAKGAKFRHSYGSQQTTISWSLATNASGRSFWTSSRDLVQALQFLPRAICLEIWMSQCQLCHWDLIFLRKFWQVNFSSLPHSSCFCHFCHWGLSRWGSFRKRVKAHSNSASCWNSSEGCKW